MDVTKASGLRRSCDGASYLAEAQKLTHTGKLGLGCSERPALHLSKNGIAIRLRSGRGHAYVGKTGGAVFIQMIELLSDSIERAISESRINEVEPESFFQVARKTPPQCRPILFWTVGNLVQFVAGSTTLRSAGRPKKLYVRRRRSSRISRITNDGRATRLLAHEVNQPICRRRHDAEYCLRWLQSGSSRSGRGREAGREVVKVRDPCSGNHQSNSPTFQKGYPQWESVDLNEIIEKWVALMSAEAARTPHRSGRSSLQDFRVMEIECNCNKC